MKRRIVHPVIAGLPLGSIWLGGILSAYSLGVEPAAPAPRTETELHFVLPAPQADAEPVAPPETLPAELLDEDQLPVTSVDLPSVLQLAGIRSPELLAARQRNVQSLAVRQLAAAQILPNLNIGMSYNDHTGALQQSSGNIISLQRQSMMLGAGVNAVGAGTVNIPGIQYNLNVSQAIFSYLSARQSVRTQELSVAASRNDVLLRVSTAYLELLRAECLRAIAVQVRDEATEVARITYEYARAGEGRRSDADRAAAELRRCEADIHQADGNVLVASAKLSQLLNLDPSIRMHAADGWVVPASLVPDPVPLSELLAIALVQRPELQSQRSAVQEAFLNLNSARLLPFSPQVMLSFSGDGFGGGGNQRGLGVPSEFGPLAGRADLDVVMYWTLQNMGLGNRALVEAMRARLAQNSYQQLAVLDRVRFEVASARARTHSRFEQLTAAEEAVRFAAQSLREDMDRIRSFEGLPIELLDSLRLVSRARVDYLNAISDYNRAHFELYVALGQPPADMLARPVPDDLVRPGAEPSPAVLSK